MLFTTYRHAVAILPLLALVGCDAFKPVPIGGNYPPVTAERLIETDFSHRTGREKFDFDWTFDEETFRITGGSIPPDLIAALLGEGASASEITGEWTIQNEQVILFIDPIAADQPAREVSLPIFFTGVIRIQTAAAQYVF